MTVAVIGKNSFLARALYKTAGAAQDTDGWRFLSHDEALADHGWTQGLRAVVNFAFAPQMSACGYDAALDVDTQLAQLVTGGAAHYVMISSRKVYGASARPVALREDGPVHPDSPYGAAKLAIEASLEDTLGQERLSIIRPSNIFGVEPGRKTFFGMALTRLLDEGKIVYDFNPDVPRDFLSVWRFSADLMRILNAPQAGVFNLGAGFGTACGDIASWLMEGYGRGELVVADDVTKDAFWMDMTKTRAAYGLDAYSPEDQKADCLRVGKALKDQG